MRRFFVILSLAHLAYFQVCAQDKSGPVAVISTEFGDIRIRLYNETPKHRDNFLKLAREGYYDGTLFHRVIQQFMIQGGDPESKNAQPGQMLGNGGPSYTIPAEFVPGLFHKKGALAAARMGDDVNPQKASSGSQFYLVQGKVFQESDLKKLEERMKASNPGFSFSAEQIRTYSTVGGTPHLDGGYTVFGEVLEGLEVIDKIAAAKTDAANRPQKDLKMTVKVVK